MGKLSIHAISGVIAIILSILLIITITCLCCKPTRKFLTTLCTYSCNKCSKYLKSQENKIEETTNLEQHKMPTTDDLTKTNDEPAKDIILYSSQKNPNNTSNKDVDTL